MSRTCRAVAAVALTVAVAATGGGCGRSAPSVPPAPSPATSSPSPTSGASTAPTTVASPAPSMVEPTTTNTLPPPPEPTAPAPSTAGRLTSRSLPVPAGWRRVARPGGAEEGYVGNGTWVHARDPRYAAQDAISIGCADVTRDDYPDPKAALEGNYRSRDGQPGIGLALDFGTPEQANDFLTVYRRQVVACTDPEGPVLVRLLPTSTGLADHRTYPDGSWTEVAAAHDRRVTLVILSDPEHRMDRGAAEQLLRRIAAVAGR